MGLAIHYGALLLKQATQPPNVIIDPAMMQNWRGFFMRVLNFSPSAPIYAAAASLLTIAAVIAVWLFAARRPTTAKVPLYSPIPEAKSGDSQTATPFNSRLWAFTLCAAMLASYHLLYPDVALAVVPGWIIASMALAQPAKDPARWAWLGWLWIGWTLGLIVNYQSINVAFAPAWLAITALLLVWANRRRTTDDGRQ